MFHICIVDDDRAARTFLSEALVDMGTLHFFVSANDLLAHIDDGPRVDMFILDIVLSGEGGNGIELCKHIMNLERYKYATVLFYTAHTSHDMEAIAFRAGATDFLEKPIAINRLRMRVAAHLKYKHMLDELIDDGLNDPLTSLYRREPFFRAVASEINRACRGQYNLSLIVLDLDKFKLINDKLGHLAGDAALKKTAEFLKKSFNREGELTGRFGGDEFLALSISYSIDSLQDQLHEFFEAANRLSFDYQGQSRQIQVSMGALIISFKAYSEPVQADRLAQQMLKLADQQLYKSKNAGRGRCSIYSCSVDELLNVSD